MKHEANEILIEIRESLKMIAEEQQRILKEVKDLRVEHRKLIEEVKLSNSILTNTGIRNEALN